MANGKTDARDAEQIERFKDTARALGCDEDETAFDETLKAIGRRGAATGGGAGGVEAKGQRSSWFATWNGESLPCVHECWKCGDRYEDPEVVPGHPRRDKFVAELSEKRRVLLTKDRLVDGFPRGRAKPPGQYLAVWEIADVSPDADALRFRFVRQIA